MGKISKIIFLYHNLEMCIQTNLVSINVQVRFTNVVET